MNKKRKISSLYQAAFIIGLVLLMLLGTVKVRAASFTEITDSARICPVRTAKWNMLLLNLDVGIHPR